MARIYGVPKAGAGGGVFSNVRVFGVQEALIKLGLVNKIARIELGVLSRKTAALMYERAQANVPVVTGNLKSGISIAKGGPYAWMVAAESTAGSDPAGVGKNQKEYAGYVEFGTSKMAPRFFMTTAFRETLPAANAGLVEIARRLERL